MTGNLYMYIYIYINLIFFLVEYINLMRITISSKTFTLLPPFSFYQPYPMARIVFYQPFEILNQLLPMYSNSNQTNGLIPSINSYVFQFHAHKQAQNTHRDRERGNGD